MAGFIPRGLTAASVTLSAFGNGTFVTAEGTPLPVGSVIRLGTFVDFGVASDPSSTFTELWNAFRPLGEGVGVVSQPGAPDPNGTLVVNQPTPPNEPGSTFGSIEEITISGALPDSVFVEGQDLVLWVFDTTDPTKLDQTNGRFGIFGATSAAGWTYSTSELTAPFLDVGALKVDAITDYLIAYRGWRDLVSESLQLAPEPTSAMLAMVGLALLAATGRRRARGAGCRE
ncbi:MAG: PEP-CTERM sorting domain-containing protein [Verrucomicrobiales bacterium]